MRAAGSCRADITNETNPERGDDRSTGVVTRCTCSTHRVIAQLAGAPAKGCLSLTPAVKKGMTGRKHGEITSGGMDIG